MILFIILNSENTRSTLHKNKTKKYSKESTLLLFQKHSNFEKTNGLTSSYSTISEITLERVVIHRFEQIPFSLSLSPYIPMR